MIHVRSLALVCFVAPLLAQGCSAPLDDQSAAGVAIEDAPVATDENALAVSSAPSVEVALERCADGTGASSRRVQSEDASVRCLTGLAAPDGAGPRLTEAVATLGASGPELFLRSSGEPNTVVTGVFRPTAPLFRPVEETVPDLPLVRLVASRCDSRARFGVEQVNRPRGPLAVFDPQRNAWGQRDIRVNFARPLPPDADEAAWRHAVLFEGAIARAVVERPTFDILHPFAERPLLVTVFDLFLPVIDTPRCASGA